MIKKAKIKQQTALGHFQAVGRARTFSWVSSRSRKDLAIDFAADT